VVNSAWTGECLCWHGWYCEAAVEEVSECLMRLNETSDALCSVREMG